ncbi:MAG: hypothetical protein IJK02_12405, partial [Clostridia bacterium]|nr:hypothetical protein [Clostridia bacterium]
ALLDLYSVILHRFSLPTARLTASNLYNLTKKSTAQSAHRNYAVLPLFFLDDLIQTVQANIKNILFGNGVKK